MGFIEKRRKKGKEMSNIIVNFFSGAVINRNNTWLSKDFVWDIYLRISEDDEERYWNEISLFINKILCRYFPDTLDNRLKVEIKRNVYEVIYEDMDKYINNITSKINVVLNRIRSFVSSNGALMKSRVTFYKHCKQLEEYYFKL